MIRINLLPYREKEKKENLQRQIVVSGGILVLVLLILAAVYLYITMNIDGLEAKIREGEAKLAVLNKKVGDIDRFKKDKKELEQKLGVIGSLEGNRLFPVKMMDELNLIFPAKDAWLDKIVTTETNLRIEGVARDNGTIALFMKSLEKASFIKSVDLVVSKEKEVTGVKLQQFILSCVMKRGS
ncbi:MAG: PilN domain-containing protein [Syntrophales bacterium]